MPRAATIRGLAILVAAGLGLPQCAHRPEAGREEVISGIDAESAWKAIDPKEVEARLETLAPFVLRYDASALTAGERALLAGVPAIGRLVDAIWLEQSHPAGNAIFAELKAQYASRPTPENRRLLEYFWINKGPFDAFAHRSFLRKVDAEGRVAAAFPSFDPGRNFYPPGFTAEAFHAWVETLGPAEAAAARSDFTAIRRDARGRLAAVPYARAYHDWTAPLAATLRRAATDVDGTPLAAFLRARAEAIGTTNDYEASEALWIALNGPADTSGGHLDITVGPYENYGDELMKRKAAFQLYVGVLRPGKTRQLAFYRKHIHRMDDRLWELYRQYRQEEREVAPGKRLPAGKLPPRWSKPGARVTLVAVDLAYSAGYANEGYQTLAYNLPNVAAWQAKYGTKKVMMMNLLDGKFQHILAPIARVVMAAGELANVDQDLFSDNTVRHEVAHGIGPAGITVNGRRTTVRERHQKYYSPFEGAKAEIVSLLFGYWLAGQGLVTDPMFTRKMAATYTASTFRTVRFGAVSDHARGKVFEFNRLMQNGGIVVKDGRFGVDPERFPAAVEKLAMEIIDLQVRGTEADARELLATAGRPTRALTRALDAVNAAGIPVDLRVRTTFGDNWGVITEE